MNIGENTYPSVLSKDVEDLNNIINYCYLIDMHISSVNEILPLTSTSWPETRVFRPTIGNYAGFTWQASWGNAAFPTIESVKEVVVQYSSTTGRPSF